MTTRNVFPRARCKGFSFIELIIAMGIIAIISAIAMPSYTSYVKKGKMRAVQADLVALSLNFENAYQRTLTYPVIAAAENDTAGLIARFQSWSPSASDVFSFTLDVSTTTQYTLKATGIVGAMLEGCELTVTHTNVRVSGGCPDGAGGWL